MHNESDKMCDRIMSAYREGYRKAIDDFVERLTTYLGIENATKYGNKNAEQMRNSYGTIRPMWLEEIAERLKAGGK